MACRLVRRLLQPAASWPAWVHFAAANLQSACPSLHPAQALLASTLASSGAVERGDMQLPPGIQQRFLPPGTLTTMVIALQRVGRLQLAQPAPTDVTALLHHPASPAADLGHDLGMLFWPSPAAGPLHPATAPVTVRDITAILKCSGYPTAA